jgi:hypothetical protein
MYSISPQNLTARLKTSKSLSELRKHANEHSSSMDAVHDSTICVNCGRFGTSDETLRSECRDFYLLAAGMWLNRPDGSFGRGARAIANILHAGAKLQIDPQNEVMRKLFQEAMRLASGFEAQHASNAIWAAATVALEDTRVITTLTQACIDRIRDMTAQGASNSLWSIVTLKVSDTRVINALIQACVELVRGMNAQEASNALLAIATLKVSDDRVITVLTQACVERVRDMNPQNAANALWSIAMLKVSDERIIAELTQACVERFKLLNAQDASNSLWSIATLKVSDERMIKALTQACIERVRFFNAQGVSNSLWSIATLKLSDERMTKALTQVCVGRVREMNAQGVSDLLWSAAVLSITDTAIIHPLTSTISDRFMSITQFEQAQQCLQAHYFGLTLTEDAVKHFHAILLSYPEPTSTSNSQLAVSSALTRLGYSPKLEVPIFDGVFTTDIVIEVNNNGGGRERVSIEFDGPSHYLRPVFGSRDYVGPIDGKTHLRNTLLKKSGLFERLITIPFYEWNEVERDFEKEEDYLKSKLSVAH